MIGLRSSSGARSYGGSDGGDRRDSVFLEMPSSDELPCRPKEYDRNDTNDTDQSLHHFGTDDSAKLAYFRSGHGSSSDPSAPTASYTASHAAGSTRIGSGSQTEGSESSGPSFMTPPGVSCSSSSAAASGLVALGTSLASGIAPARASSLGFKKSSPLARIAAEGAFFARSRSTPIVAAIAELVGEPSGSTDDDEGPSFDDEGPSYETLETTTDDDDNDNEEEDDDDPELGQYTSDAESSMPTIPSTLMASPSRAELGDYTPKCDVAPRSFQFKDRKVSTRIDVDDAILHYNRMVLLLGNDTTPPIITCNPSTDSQRTMEPVDLEELKNVLEKEPKEEIGILYDAIMKELAQGRGEEGDSQHDGGEGGGRVGGGSTAGSRRSGSTRGSGSRRRRGDGGSRSNKTTGSVSRRDKVECLLECYASIAGGSTLPSTLGGSSTSGNRSRSNSSATATVGKQVEIVITEEVKLEVEKAEKAEEEMEQQPEPASQPQPPPPKKRFIPRKLPSFRKNIVRVEKDAPKKNKTNEVNSNRVVGKRKSPFANIFSKKKLYSAAGKKSGLKKKGVKLTKSAPPRLLADAAPADGPNVSSISPKALASSSSGSRLAEIEVSQKVTTPISSSPLSSGVAASKDGPARTSSSSPEKSDCADESVERSGSNEQDKKKEAEKKEKKIGSKKSGSSTKSDKKKKIKEKRNSNSGANSVEKSSVSSTSANERDCGIESIGKNSSGGSVEKGDSDAKSDDKTASVQSLSIKTSMGTEEAGSTQLLDSASADGSHGSDVSDGFEVVRDGYGGEDKIEASTPSNSTRDGWVSSADSIATSMATSTNGVMRGKKPPSPCKDEAVVPEIEVPGRTAGAVSEPGKDPSLTPDSVSANAKIYMLSERKSSAKSAAAWSRRARSMATRSKSPSLNRLGSVDRSRSLGLLGRKKKERHEQDSEMDIGSMLAEASQSCKSIVPKDGAKPQPLAKAIGSVRMNSRSSSLSGKNTPTGRTETNLTKRAQQLRVAKKKQRQGGESRAASDQGGRKQMSVGIPSRLFRNISSPVRIRSKSRSRSLTRRKAPSPKMGDSEKGTDGTDAQEEGEGQIVELPLITSGLYAATKSGEDDHGEKEGEGVLDFDDVVASGSDAVAGDTKADDEPQMEAGVASESASVATSIKSKTGSSASAATSATSAKSKSPTSAKSRSSPKSKPSVAASIADAASAAGSQEKAAARDVEEATFPRVSSVRSSAGSENDAAAFHRSSSVRSAGTKGDDTISFVDRDDLLSLSGRIVSKGVENWFSWTGAPSKSYETLQVDARCDVDAASDERRHNHPSNWLSWNNTVGSCEENREGCDTRTECVESPVEDAIAGWFSCDGSVKSKDHGSLAADDGEDCTSKEKVMVDGWLSHLSKYLTVTTPGEDDDDGEGELIAKDGVKKTGSGRGRHRRTPSGRSGRSNSLSKYRESRRRSKSKSRARKSSEMDSAEMDKILVL